MLRFSFDRLAMEEAGATLSNEWRGNGERRYLQNVLTLGTRRIDVAQDGEVTLHGGDLLTEAPTDIASFVTEVSYYDNFGYGFTPRRRLGCYRFRSASAELQEIGGDHGHYHVRIRAKNVADLRELYELIRQGQIWPALDYEAEQVPPPLRHLRDAVSELWQLLRRDIRERLYRIQEQVVG